MQLFDITEFDTIACDSCGEVLEHESDRRDSGLSCAECYVNDECPDGCSEEHDEPTADYDGQWQCPTSENIYVRDDGTWELQSGRYPSSSTYVDRASEWYIYPGDHGWYSCCDCGEWIDEDDIRNNRYGDGYCRDCYSDNYSGYDDEGYEAEVMVVRCEVAGCRNHTITHWNPITEQVGCGCDTTGMEPVPTLVAA